MNPPYGDLAPLFVARLLIELGARVTEAIVLLNANAMTSAWFHTIYPAASSLVVSRGRPDFTPGDPDKSANSPTTGKVYVYFGLRSDRFVAEFSKHGAALSVCKETK